MTHTHTNTNPVDDVARPLPPRPSIGQRLVDALLSVLAFAGVVCIIAVICAFVFNISLIMFKTGSMSPTIPAGSLAIVREIPASDVRVGDVTTIDRDNQLPVTHRVVAVDPAGGDAYTIRMKGDANDEEDPYPYTESTVRKVMFSLDGVGMWVAKIQNPKVMAGTTVIMALLVTWVFWPKGSSRNSPSKSKTETSMRMTEEAR